ncbi:MAG: hypothetical protein HQ492_07775 [Woeseiaceae bacterium]|nr:hypothetical protein [Woeseiaceae bacterium]
MAAKKSNTVVVTTEALDDIADKVLYIEFTNIIGTGAKGTCSILGRCVKTLGSDIATWLQNPTMNAMPGNS